MSRKWLGNSVLGRGGDSVIVGILGLHFGGKVTWSVGATSDFPRDGSVASRDGTVWKLG